MRVNAIPEKLINFNVYYGNDKLIGINGDVSLPKLEPMSSTVSGAGIAGEYESPTPGHFGKLEIDISWNTIGEQCAELLIPGTKSLVFRASQQSYDVAGGNINYRALKVTVKVLSKGVELGKLAVGKQTGTKNTFEIIYIKVEEDGKTLIEVDKLNFVYKVNGVDVLAAIRSQI